jgi:virginiamycin B lyase
MTTALSSFRIAGIIFLMQLLLACGGSEPEPMGPLARLATLKGSVTAPGEFTAAKVYARHLDKNIIYMVYTAAGSYETVAMFPGRYEVWVEKLGFDSDRHAIDLPAGGAASIDFELRASAAQQPGQGRFMGLTMGERLSSAPLVPYDELYPDAPIKPLIESTCIQCHGKSYLAFYHRNEAQWDATIGAMMVNRIPQGKVSPEQRKLIAQYLATHFGEDSPDRRIKADIEIPLDEAALASAQYVEYVLPLNEARPKRWLQEVHIDFDGNVWYTERTVPNLVGRLDPRSGEITEWPLPEPTADPHGLTIDSDGNVFWAEVDGGHLGRLNPTTGEMTRFPYDPSGKLGFLGGHTPVLDPMENVWFTLIYGDALGRWDRESEKIEIWRVPSKSSMPYGMDLAPNGKPVLAELYGCAIAVFDPDKQSFTEYPALVEPPCVTRRLGIDGENVVWYGVFSQGRLGKLDLTTGERKEYAMASSFSEPYDVWRDRNTGLLWISDAGQGGAIVQFNPETEKFTYYPSPRSTDFPKMDVSSDGHVWYSTRAIPDGGIGVLYPDKWKITSLAALREGV